MSFPSPEPLPLEAAQPLRVLVVDGDQFHSRSLERQLRDAGDIEVIIAGSAIDAMLSIGARCPDLLVMDAAMPGLDALELCRRIRMNPGMSGVQIALTSDQVTRDLEEAALEAGARLVRSKPIDALALVDELFEPPEVTAELAPLPKLVRCADVLVSMLEQAGVEFVFGIPGGPISPIHDALLDSKIRTITTRHESGAMFAAAGYARATGKLGVVAVTSGPGILNAMTGLATAWADSTPLLLLVGEVPRPLHGKGVLQDGSAHGLNVVEMTRHISKLSVEVAHGSALPHILQRAVTTAVAGRPGPVVVTLPLDMSTGKIAPPRCGGRVEVKSEIDPALIGEIGALLARAERPMILAGCGLRGGTAPAQLRALAERLSCPVVTTPKGKGVFPEDHPLALGVLGVGGHRSSRRYLETGVDLVLAIGTSLGDIATEGFQPHLQAPALIHVDIDPQQIGRSYSPTHAVVAPAADFLDALSDHFAKQRPRSRAVLGRTGGILRHALASSAKSDRVAGHEALAEIQEVVPNNTIFAVDSGEHFIFATHFLELTQPDSYLVMTGLGSMGPSIGAAIGAQLARPDRFVAAICGDGCFAMNAFEIATAVAEHLPIRVFVFNDERLGMVEIACKRIYGRTPDYALKTIDVCTLAQGLGATSLRVNGPGQIRAARSAILHTRGPLVVDVRIDPEIFITRSERVAAMVSGPALPK